MSRPPDYIDGAKVLCYCVLDKHVVATGKHSIVIDGHQVVPAAVAICLYERNSVYYRFFCDGEWEVLSDFDYSSIQEAIDEVENSYTGARGRFTFCGKP